MQYLEISVQILFFSKKTFKILSYAFFFSTQPVRNNLIPIKYSIKSTAIIMSLKWTYIKPLARLLCCHSVRKQQLMLVNQFSVESDNRGRLLLGFHFFSSKRKAAKVNRDSCMHGFVQLFICDCAMWPWYTGL